MIFALRRYHHCIVRCFCLLISGNIEKTQKKHVTQGNWHDIFLLEAAKNCKQIEVLLKIGHASVSMSIIFSASRYSLKPRVVNTQCEGTFSEVSRFKASQCWLIFLHPGFAGRIYAQFSKWESLGPRCPG